MRSNKNRFLVLYGSQTGQSKAIGEILVDRTEKLGLNPDFYELDANGKKFILEKEALAIIICSSTGDGEPPDNAERFVKWLGRRSQPLDLLKGTTFALLGLGDSNYSSFQKVPRFLEKNLLRLGAKKLTETGVADDQVGLELTVEPWLDQVILKLVEWFQLPSDSSDKLVASGRDILANPDKSEMSEPEDMSFEEEEEEEVQEVILKASKVVWPDDKPCLIKGSETLCSEKDLRVPVLATTYLASRVTHEKFVSENIPWQNGCHFPGAVNEVLDARVVGTIELTDPSAIKIKREIHIDLGKSMEKVKYEPGDVFYFIVPNPRDEVNFILQRMNLLTVADQKCMVCVHPRTEKQNASMPGHIPETSSLRYIFTYCLDIRRSPGRPLLRFLAENAKNEAEKRRLTELCSAQGTNEFAEYVRQAGISLADLLFAFPSCQPRADRLMELLPRLQPRAYSVACSPLRWGSRLRFIYSLLEFPVGEGRHFKRYGLSSGWLASLKIGDSVKVLFKEPAKFRFPPPSIGSVDIRRIPLIMVGPGTGIAPFLSVLQHIYEKNLSDDEIITAERELYFGCRRLDIDCICRDEMEFYRREKILSHLDICESQPEAGKKSDRPVYVQDALIRKGKQVAEMLTRLIPEGEQPTRVYVCGDAKGMSKNVWDTFVTIIAKHTGKSDEESKQFMDQLKKTDRYLEDVWV